MTRSWFTVLCLALSFVIPAAVYIPGVSLAPSSWDTAELQTCIWVLGIAHPTGFPLYILGGWFWAHLLPFGTPAWRINLLSALLMAGTATVICATAIRLKANPLVALAGSLVFAFGNIASSKATIAEVHVPALFLLTLMVYFVTRAATGDRAALVKAAWLEGFALATHPIAIWCLPGLLFVALATRISLRAVGFCVIGIFVPLLLYAYLPIRANSISVSPLVGAAPVIRDRSSRTLSGFIVEATGSQFAASGFALASFDVRHYPASFALWWPTLEDEIGPIAFVFAMLGALVLLRRQPIASIALLLMGMGAIPFTALYRGVEGDWERYYLLSYAVACIFASQGVRREVVAGTALLAFAAWTLYGAHPMRSPDFGSQPLIDVTAAIIPPNSIIIDGWIDATSLAYGAYVEGRFPGSTVITWNNDYIADLPQWREVGRVFIVGPVPTLPASITTAVTSGVTELCPNGCRQ